MALGLGFSCYRIPVPEDASVVTQGASIIDAEAFDMEPLCQEN